MQAVLLGRFLPPRSRSTLRLSDLDYHQKAIPGGVWWKYLTSTARDQTVAFRVSPFCDDPSLQTAAAENPAEEELLSTLRFKMQGCNLLIADSGILSFFFFFFHVGKREE